MARPVHPEHATSLVRARRIASLIATGALPTGHLVSWDDELPTLVIPLTPRPRKRSPHAA